MGPLGVGLQAIVAVVIAYRPHSLVGCAIDGRIPDLRMESTLLLGYKGFDVINVISDGKNLIHLNPCYH